MALDFSFSPEHEAVRDMVRRFAQDKMAPLVNEAEEKRGVPARAVSPMGRARSAGRALSAGRMAAPRHGQAGRLHHPRGDERRLARRCLQLVGPYPSGHLADLARRHAGAEERFFRPALTGHKISAFGLSEPDGGSNMCAAHPAPSRWKAAGASPAASCTSPMRPSRLHAGCRAHRFRPDHGRDQPVSSSNCPIRASAASPS